MQLNNIVELKRMERMMFQRKIILKVVRIPPKIVILEDRKRS